MKVYIVTKESYPNGMAATNRIKCFVGALVMGGLNCEVIVCTATELPDKVMNNDVRGSINGGDFVYPGGKVVRSKIRFLRPFFDLIYRYKTIDYLKAKIKEGDVLFLYMGGKVDFMLKLMKVAKEKGAYCIRDLCELPYGTGDETQKAIRMRKVTLEKQLPKLDGVISISDSLYNLARTYTLPACKHIKVPIMVDYPFYAIKEHEQTKNNRYIFHAGTLDQQKDGILGVFEAFGKASQKLNYGIKYILTGGIEQSRYSRELKQIIEKYKIEGNVDFVGYLYRDTIKEYLKGASLVISNRIKSKQNYYGFSTKVGEYLASGTPLLTTNWGEAGNWLENGKSAYIVDAEDTEALADAIVQVFTHPEESKKIGLAGQEVCRNSFDYRNWSLPLVEFMNQLGK